MKKLLLLLLIAPVIGFGQGEQPNADGTATDQDGNIFEWINYGTQDWAIENAEVVTYKDGTPIQQVTSVQDLTSSNIGAYFSTSYTIYYNWFAIMGVHDNDEDTANKGFAPEGWSVPTKDDYDIFKVYLNDNGFGCGNEGIGKSIASVDGWDISENSVSACDVGSDLYLLSTYDYIPDNNSSLFNAFPYGYAGGGTMNGLLYFWTSSSSNNFGIMMKMRAFESDINVSSSSNDYDNHKGYPVRFVRDASTASTKDYSNSISIYPNPTSSIINIEQDFTTAKVYDISGRELLKSTSKTIDLSELPSSIYLLRLYDNSNKVLGTSKVVKQ